MLHPASVPRLRVQLERLYRTFNHRSFVAPDPLQFLYRYRSLADREIAGFIASALAYGTVAQITRSIASVLEPMGAHPAAFVRAATPASLAARYATFIHRFTTGDHLVRLLLALDRVMAAHGSLHACFCACVRRGDETVVPALGRFVALLTDGDDAIGRFLVPSPARGSACKRLNLFLRWMVRQDEVDPGGWKGVPPSMLVVPLDTHMARICRMLDLTRRSQDDLRTALEITRAFGLVAPDDPVRYDFALTRLGMRGLLLHDGCAAKPRTTCIQRQNRV